MIRKPQGSASSWRRGRSFYDLAVDPGEIRNLLEPQEGRQEIRVAGSRTSSWPTAYRQLGRKEEAKKEDEIALKLLPSTETAE